MNGRGEPRLGHETCARDRLRRPGRRHRRVSLLAGRPHRPRPARRAIAPRRPSPRPDDDLCRRDRAARARRARRPRGRGARSPTTPAHAPPREGVAVPSRTGFSTAYVGSSNLSHARACSTDWSGTSGSAEAESPHLLEKFRTVFEQLLGDPEFEPYEPRRDSLWRCATRAGAERDARDLALDPPPAVPAPATRSSTTSTPSERHGRTGTSSSPPRAPARPSSPRSTTPAPRRAASGRRDAALRRPPRGDPRPEPRDVPQRRSATGRSASCSSAASGRDAWRHVFASIQSLAHARPRRASRPTHFDVVIVDEFHHAAAPTYTRLLEHLEPTVLLGLTATPERTDGQIVLRLVRRADRRRAPALGCARSAAARAVPVLRHARRRRPAARSSGSAAGYDVDELEQRLHRQRRPGPRVLQRRAATVADVASDAGARVLRERRARRVHGARSSPSTASPRVRCHGRHAERERARRRSRELRAGDVQRRLHRRPLQRGRRPAATSTPCCSCGPTESATVFLQQLGRGLRRADDKPCLTVLDFIGDQHRRFRFDVRYRALTGSTRARARPATSRTASRSSRRAATSSSIASRPRSSSRTSSARFSATSASSSRDLRAARGRPARGVSGRGGRRARGCCTGPA